MAFFPKMPSSRLGHTQTVAFDDSAPVQNPFGPETWQVRLVANEPCHFRIGDGQQTATVADIYLPPNTIEYVIVSPGNRISAIKATEYAGTLWITETS